MKYDFTYNGRVIAYEIVRKNVKNINIRVKPTGDVIVSCNDSVDNLTIELNLIKRANWLFESIDEYKTNVIEFSKTNLRLVDGEAFMLLGKILRIQNKSADNFMVEYDNNYLYIYRPNSRGIKIKFEKWYKNFTMQKFKELVNMSYDRFSKYGIKKPTVIYKNMRTQWGSCNIAKNIITLNAELIKVDPFLTEYVVCHELTHLLYHNHDSNFYAFLTSMVPDWKNREKILNSIFISN